MPKKKRKERKKGLESLLQNIPYHLSENKAKMIAGLGGSFKDIMYRFDLANRIAGITIEQLEKIRDIAEQKGDEEILEILDADYDYKD